MDVTWLSRNRGLEQETRGTRIVAKRGGCSLKRAKPIRYLTTDSDCGLAQNVIDGVRGGDRILVAVPWRSPRRIIERHGIHCERDDLSLIVAIVANARINGCKIARQSVSQRRQTVSDARSVPVAVLRKENQIVTA
jgi:hypothetical protein